ncbi:hypothetical protein LTR84_002704 [Exophiala bonariae]|uniref:FAD-binding PCMH-type domain-containing protein n=1 Tax=Exophiala bonariae TaxID=1690606 RepID=A0AAV9N9F6_9EURO|nr:hypothetical protein LTR84_002704 [Exophiala bonariae]
MVISSSVCFSLIANPSKVFHIATTLTTETLNSLKLDLRQAGSLIGDSLELPLSDEQYSNGFEILARNAEYRTYQDFIILQLLQLFNLLLRSIDNISVLEIGPGPESVLGYLPGHQRDKITKYFAFEPNELFATKLEQWLSPIANNEIPLPSLQEPGSINRSPFQIQHKAETVPDDMLSDLDGQFNVILFCHSMYGMKPKRKFIERALEMLVEQPQHGMVLVFHRGEALQTDGLVCSRSATFPGVVRVDDDDEVLDRFAPFLAGFVVEDANIAGSVRVKWRQICRTMGHRDEAYPDHLSFSSPNTMVAFDKHATSLPELTRQVPLISGGMAVKSFEARSLHPTALVRPTETRHVQKCVQWALEHGTRLTVVSGNHSGHCLQSNVVAVDMGAFDQIHVLTEGDDQLETQPGPLVFVGSGCKTGDIIRETKARGLTVPLGARPSVGAGLWLQGGIEHLARSHGLACDSIIGAVLVSVDSARVLYIGSVPSQHQIAGAVRAENDRELLWATRGAGTNFGIVISVTFKAYAAPTFMTRHWDVPLNNNFEAQRSLSAFDNRISCRLPQNCAADAYLYQEGGQLRLGVSMFESTTTSQDLGVLVPTVDRIWDTQAKVIALDSVSLFDAEMYMSGMHGGHAGGKTSSFKRCLFLKDIGMAHTTEKLVLAMESRPSPLCYIHLLHGGGVVRQVAPKDTAFGCRDWDYACVITGVWPRDQDNSGVTQAVVHWVYSVTERLLPLCCGVYGADLGPDPRDAALALKAFGNNLPRLAALKKTLDPHNVLAYGCPLLKAPEKQKLIILVTGESGVGKDYCADIWAEALSRIRDDFAVRVVSISEAIKREYAQATGANVDFLLRNRAYKEQHRAKLTKFYNEQLQQRPQLLQENFLAAVNLPLDSGVLMITGMREDAPVAAFAHLVPSIKIVEVHVQAGQRTRQVRRGCHSIDEQETYATNSNEIKGKSKSTLQYSQPEFIFDNNKSGSDSAKTFDSCYLAPLIDEGVQRLADMVRSVPDFSTPGIEFRHILNICQEPDGMVLCSSLMQPQLSTWSNVDAAVGCEAGGFLFASALTLRLNKRLLLIREAGKLPPPTISVVKPRSFISSFASQASGKLRIKLERNMLKRHASVIVVDDVLSTGHTLCAILQLLTEAGVDHENIRVLVVAEFPAHQGQQLLREPGFGRVGIQNILVFGGA